MRKKRYSLRYHKPGDKWFETTIQLSNDTKFQLMHTIPHADGSINSLDAALTSWLVRTTETTPESLIAYINSKTEMSGHKAMSIEDYQKLKQNE